jgi:hypothetical protein
VITEVCEQPEQNNDTSSQNKTNKEINKQKTTKFDMVIIYDSPVTIRNYTLYHKLIFDNF